MLCKLLQLCKSVGMAWCCPVTLEQEGSRFKSLVYLFFVFLLLFSMSPTVPAWISFECSGLIVAFKSATCMNMKACFFVIFVIDWCTAFCPVSSGRGSSPL